MPLVLPNGEQRYDFFFYGTLCHPAILQRVLGRNCEDLTFQDAHLPDWARHKVKNEDYPALISAEQTSELLSPNQQSQTEEVNTRGTLVRGLTYPDVKSLDLFEGPEYDRIKLPCQPLGTPSGLSHIPPDLANPLKRSSMDKISARKEANGRPGMRPSNSQETGLPERPSGAVGEAANGAKGEEQGSEAWTYIWKDQLNRLEPEVWQFDEFLKDKAHVWLGADHHEFTDLEELKAKEEEDGSEERLVGRTAPGFEDFGHGMLKYWNFRKGLVPLNHGSYGSVPKPVIAKMHELQLQIESFPDLFMRKSYFPMLENVRGQIADLINAEHDEVVIVPNATHGINTIINNIEWDDGDIILIYSTTYGAIGQTAKYVCDRHPKVRLEFIEDRYPCPPEQVVRETKEMLERYNKPAPSNFTIDSRPVGVKKEERIRLVVVDQIASNPGVKIPWEGIVSLCREFGAISLVDAAHALGQVKVDIKAVDPDFWVSNGHKWLLSHRPSAVMYVPLRNQKIVLSSFPTSAGYESKRYPTPGHRDWSFVKQYEWNGTTDWAPTMSLGYAIEFRKSLGGEERIMAYNHSLAVEGGKRLHKRWGTQIMDTPKWELTAAMVNVELPNILQPKDLDEAFRIQHYIEQGLFRHNVYAAPYRHADKWWARFSAQVWNELSDFDVVAGVIETLADEIRQGKHEDIEQPVEEELIHTAEDMLVHDE